MTTAESALPNRAPWLPTAWPVGAASGNWWTRHGLRVRYVEVLPGRNWRVLLTESGELLCSGCGRTFPVSELGHRRSTHRDAGAPDRVRMPPLCEDVNDAAD